MPHPGDTKIFLWLLNPNAIIIEISVILTKELLLLFNIIMSFSFESVQNNIKNLLKLQFQLKSLDVSFFKKYKEAKQF